MKLYYKPGACSLASHIALIETGTEVELEQVDTQAGLTASGEDFSKISRNGYVPALRTATGDIITENPAVLQFIADLKPEAKLAPASSSFERVRLHELLNFVSSELHKAFSPFFSGQELTAEDRAAAETRVGQRIGYIEHRLADDGEFLLGDDFTVADAYAFVVINWANFVGIDLASWPMTRAFLERVQSRPSVIKAMTAEGLIAEGQAA